MPLSCQKHLFNLHPEVHYLNCAYKAPLLKSAEEATMNALIKERNPSDISSTDFFDGVASVRTLFGKIVNCTPEQVAILPSTSYGFKSVLNNIAAKPGGNAIGIEDEFPSGYFALESWCREHDNELLIISPDNERKNVGGNWNDKIINAINENTSVVLMSAIHWMTGLKFDLKAIGDKCAEVGAKFILDGSQTIGAMPVDIAQIKVDAIICAGYKWLFGPYSIAIGYIGPAFDNGKPLEESWMNRKNASDFSNLTNYEKNYEAGAARYNVGEASNLTTMPILEQGLKQLLEWGIPEIQNYCKYLTLPLKHYLKELHVELEEEKYFSEHIFSLRLPAAADTDLLKEILKKNKIIMSFRADKIRVSVNVFNDENDIKKLISSIEQSFKLVTN